MGVRTALGKGKPCKLCKLLHNSQELAKSDTVGSQEDIVLTVVWINIPGMFAEDVLIAQRAFDRAKEYQAAVDRQQQELGRAKAMLEEARKRQTSVLKVATYAESVVFRSNLAHKAEDDGLERFVVAEVEVENE